MALSITVARDLAPVGYTEKRGYFPECAAWRSAYGQCLFCRYCSKAILNQGVKD